MAVTITRTAWIDDDGTGTTGTVINNAVKQELYDQIDAALAKMLPLAGGAALAGPLQINYNGTVTQGLILNDTAPASAATAIWFHRAGASAGSLVLTATGMTLNSAALTLAAATSILGPLTITTAGASVLQATATNLQMNAVDGMPWLAFVCSNAAANARLWDIYAGLTSLTFRTVADGYAAASNFLVVTRNAGSSAIVNTNLPSAVRMANYGAGNAVFDASGNITSSSDGRLKDRVAPLPYGLDEVLDLAPVQFGFNEDSGMEREHLYGGFLAADVQRVIPLAVGMNPDGWLSLADRPILGALVNAVKTLHARIAQLEGKD